MKRNVSGNVSAHFFGSLRRGCLSGSIAALLAGAVIFGAGSANAEEEESTSLFWLGQTSGLWTQQNWAYNAAGSPTEQTPSCGTNVIFSATGAQNQTTNLGANIMINTLTINDPTAVTINGTPVSGEEREEEGPKDQSMCSTNTLTITGTYGITVNSGAGLLTINANVAFTGTSTVITINNAAGAIINGVISGPSSLIKSGVGSLDLTGFNTYTGDTIVNAGTLLVDGSIASANTYIQFGALLGGHGTINGNLLNGGVVSPGNSPGTLTIGGNYTQAPAGTLLIQIGGLAAAQHDLLTIGGIASLNGTLQLQQLNGFKFGLGQTVTFLTATGGVSGQFSSVIDPFVTDTLIGEKIIYSPNSVGVEGVQLPITSIPGETPNELAVANALDHVLTDPHFARIISHLDNEPLNQVVNDLDRLGPAELTSIFEIAIAQAEAQTFNIQRRLEDLRWGSNGFTSSGFAMNGSAPGYAGPLGDGGFLQGPDGKSSKMSLAPSPDNRLGVFITGNGEFTTLGDTDNARGYDLTSAGFTLGVDYRVTDHLVIGLAAGYDRSDADLSGGGRITVDGGKLALYGTCFTGTGFYTDFAVQGGYDNYDTTRAAVDGSARGTTDGGELNVLFGTGYDWKIGGLTFGPTANFEYSYLGVNGSEERGSLAPLDLSNQSQESLRSTFGAKVSYECKCGGVRFVPELRVGWQHEYGDNTFQFQSQFEGGGPSFAVQGPSTGRDSLIVGAGFAIRWNDRVSTYVYYDGELGRVNYESNNISGGMRIEF